MSQTLLESKALQPRPARINLDGKRQVFNGEDKDSKEDSVRNRRILNGKPHLR